MHFTFLNHSLNYYPVSPSLRSIKTILMSTDKNSASIEQTPQLQITTENLNSMVVKDLGICKVEGSNLISRLEIS